MLKRIGLKEFIMYDLHDKSLLPKMRDAITQQQMPSCMGTACPLSLIINGLSSLMIYMTL